MKFTHLAASVAAVTIAGVLGSTASAAVFSFQQGDLRQDGVLFGAGASYTGAKDGTVTDNNPTGTITSITTNAIGNQFQATSNANRGTNGVQFNGLFSYDLTELSTYLATNPGASVSEVSFKLITAQTGSAGATLNLYKTDAFTSSASWNTYDGTNAWSSPNPVNTGGVTGGGAELSKLNSNAVFSTSGSPMTWNNSANSNFVDAVNDALARGDKTLYMAVITDGGFNGDARVTYSDLGNATVDNRPELLITTTIPEPTSVALLGLGGLFLRRRSRA